MGREECRIKTRKGSTRKSLRNGLEGRRLRTAGTRDKGRIYGRRKGGGRAERIVEREGWGRGKEGPGKEMGKVNEKNSERRGMGGGKRNGKGRKWEGRGKEGGGKGEAAAAGPTTASQTGRGHPRGVRSGDRHFPLAAAAAAVGVQSHAFLSSR